MALERGGPTIGDLPRFAAADVKPYHYENNGRWLIVQWRNLSTGASGAVDLRHWDLVDVPNIGDVYARKLPFEVVADTGPGHVAVVVTQSYEVPIPLLLNLFPGLGLLSVP